MLLQLAIDAPEHFALIPRLARWFDIIEVGTPVLKRFGISAITTATELSGGTPILADTKTVDASTLEATMVFTAGASWMTVLSNAGATTRANALEVARAHGGEVIFDTIVAADPAGVRLDVAAGERWLGLHSAFDNRGAASDDGRHIELVAHHKALGHRTVLAGGIGPDNFSAVLATAPDVAVIGSSVTSAADPEGVAQWLRTHYPISPE